MNGNHACGVDMIDGFSVKLAYPLIEDVILHLVNLSLTKSHFPQYWKVSRIAPYHKKGDKQLAENYRPVSNLIYIGMICEKAVAEQIFHHFDQNNLWHENHHGFRPNHNTATALISLMDLWFQAADIGKMSGALLLDFSAAFDLVDHRIFLGKLKLYGCGEKTIEWRLLISAHTCVANSTFLLVARLSPPGS